MTPITLHKRKPLTTNERVKLFRDHGGLCCICGGKIHAPKEAWIDEHELALALGGTNDWENRGPAHVACAKEKTRKDMAAIAEAKRREAKHIGAARPKRRIQSRGFEPWISNTKFINLSPDEYEIDPDT